MTERLDLKILLFFMLLSPAPAYGNGSGVNKPALTQEEIEKKDFDSLSQPILDEIKTQGENGAGEQANKDEEKPIRMTLPKYTKMQIKEMKAKGIDPEALEEKTKPAMTEEDKQSKQESEESEKVIYYNPQSACAHLRLGQVCEYRKAGYGRWIGNCATKANTNSLYCK